jgi:type VI secretion system Hcp family effector
MRFHTARSFVLCAAVSALLPSVTAFAAVDAYLTIEGTRQGKFKGEVSRAGAPADSIRILSVARESAPSGLATGRRSHAVITIVREVDAASPKFAQALATNEVLKQVVITFQTSGAGAGKDAQQIELTNATIAGIRRSGNTETITLDYPTIAVTYAKGGKAATDDWSVPR